MTMAGELDRGALRFGSYRVLQEIGRGGVARVYRAEHERLGQHVAVKVVDVARATSPAKVRRLAARLLREGRSAAQLRHPHIVDVLDIGDEQGVPYLVMELVEGGTLADLLEERDKLPVAELVALLLPVIHAVAHSHRHGVVHRDLKPENVLLGRDLDGAVSPKLSDFGVCRSSERNYPQQLTQDGGLVGTLTYMAPEQLSAPRLAGPAADQYALGAMLYRGATGRLPLSEADPVRLMQQIASGVVVSPRNWEPSLPDGFAEVVLRALARDPSERFPSVLALGQALLRFASGKAWSAWANRLGGEVAPNGSSSHVVGTTWADSQDSVDTPLPLSATAPPRSANRRISWASAGIASVAITALSVFVLRDNSASSRAARAPALTTSLACVASALPELPQLARTAASQPTVTEPALPPTRTRTSHGAATARIPSVAVAAEAPRVELGRNGSPILP